MNIRKIVCAANYYPTAMLTLLGARHYEGWMLAQRFALACDLTSEDLEREEQGFIDNQGNFHSRTEAWKIASAAGQIVSRCGGDKANGGTLYSENLY